MQWKKNRRNVKFHFFRNNTADYHAKLEFSVLTHGVSYPVSFRDQCAHWSWESLDVILLVQASLQ